MIRRRLTWCKAWPWLLIILVVALGPIIASCAPSAPAATPTPTKTPRCGRSHNAAAGDNTQPAPTNTAVDTPSPEPSETGTEPPTETAAPAATPQPPTAAPVQTGELMTSPDFGVQAFLWWREEVADRDLQLIRDGGFRWVKQYFAWQDMEGAGTRPDRLDPHRPYRGPGREIRPQADRAP